MEDIKNLILDKAKERAERFGFKKTTMDEISADCGISKKTIYQHFANKDDMFKSLVIREGQRNVKMLFTQIENISNPTEKLIQLIRNSVEFFNQEHFITKIFKEEKDFALSDKSYREIIDAEVISLIAKIICDGKIKGAFRDVDEKVIAYAGLKLFHSFTVSRTGFLQQENDQHHTEVLIDFILNGIIKS